MAFQSAMDSVDRRLILKETVTACQVPERPEITRRFRELSEDFWRIQKFDSSQFAEAEAIPLITPSGELEDEGIYKTFMTNAVSTDVSTLMNSIETTFQTSSIFGAILRCILVRVKSGKKIYPHIDDTFLGTDHEIYRMQLVSSTDKPFWTMTDSLGNKQCLSPVIYEMRRLPHRLIQSEENPGLNDNIHALIYIQRVTATQELAKLTAVT